MSIISRLMASIGRHWKRILTVITITVAIIGALIGFGNVMKYSETFIRASVDGQAGQIIKVRTWPTFAIAFGVYVVFILAISLVLVLRLYRAKGDVRRKLYLTDKTLRKMMTAALKIVRHIFPYEETPPYIFDKVKYTYVVSKDGGGTLQAYHEIRAYRTPLHFWDVQVNAEPVAKGVEFLDELDFKVRDTEHKDGVSYLVTKNARHSKQVSIFFLPAIQPVDDRRHILYKYSWPGVFNKLIGEGEEDFLLTVESRERVQVLEYCVFFHPDIMKKKMVECERLSPPVGGESLQRVESEENGWPGWRYQVRGGPADGFKYHLRFSLKETRSAPEFERTENSK